MHRNWWPMVMGCVLALAGVSAVTRYAGPQLASATSGPDEPAVVERDGPLTADDPAGNDAPAAAHGAETRPIQIATTVGSVSGLVVTPMSPSRDPGWPGLVLIAGSGPSTAASMLPWATRLASKGVATVVYDKRSQGYSFVRRDFQGLASDAVAAAQLLRSVTGVDPDRVGAAGFSEGGWIVPGLGHGLADSSGAPSRMVVGLVADWATDPPASPVPSARGGAPVQRHPVIQLSEPPGG